MQILANFSEKQLSSPPIPSPPSPPKFLILKNYILKNLIGKGSFSQVYEAVSLTDNENYIAKILDNQSSNSNEAQFTKEALILLNLKGQEGFPELKELIKTESKEILIMNKLGCNLNSLAVLNGGCLPLKTLLNVGIQCIKRIETLHTLGYVHGDVKPDNFVLGAKGEENLIHLIDFGFSNSYLDENKQHIKFQRNSKVCGTLCYMSVNTQLGIQPTRRDDLISLGFTLIHLFHGGLPWKDVKGNYSEKYQLVCSSKVNAKPRILCKGLPEEFVEYFNHVLNLKFEEKPDYNHLMSLFKRMKCIKEIKNSAIQNQVFHSPGINLNGRKLGPSLSIYYKGPLDG